MPWVKVWGCSTQHMLVRLHPLVLPLSLLLFFTPSLASAPAWLLTSFVSRFWPGNTQYLRFPRLVLNPSQEALPVPVTWRNYLFKPSQLQLGLAPRTSNSMALLEERSKK